MLASDTLEGREAGTRGGRAAGAYIVDELRKLNAEPAGIDGGYYQEFGRGLRNILVRLPGSDPELRNEYVVIGGHYDHVGYGRQGNSFGPFGYIHNGADDNASGVSGLLELFEALSTSHPPRRTILFAFWDGEEQGLLGSKHWVRQPTVPLGQVVFLFNTDMIGRLEEPAEVLGVRTTTGLRQLVSRNNVEKVALRFNRDIAGDSDHFPFVQQRIPYLMLFTGKHGDYHRPSDDVDKVNFEGMRRIVRLIFRLVHHVGNADQRVTFRPECHVENERAKKNAAANRRASRPSRLGVSYVPQPDGSAFISSIRYDSAARVAGIRPGDRVIRFNGVSTSEAELSDLVELAVSPVEVVLTRTGLANPLSLQVPLAGTPSTFGIEWFEDAAEPGCVVLSRVYKTSSAEKMGLKSDDRVMAFGNKPVADGKTFRALLSASVGENVPSEFVVERDGIIRRVTVNASAGAADQRGTTGRGDLGFEPTVPVPSETRAFVPPVPSSAPLAPNSE